jgi:hypothetical protein
VAARVALVVGEDLMAASGSAWMDESGYDRAEGCSVVLAAVRHSMAGIDELREDLRGLVLGGAGYLHWRDEADERRGLVISVLNAHELKVHVVSADRVARKQKERARSLCLRVLLRSLEAAGVNDLVAETRGSELDLRDHHTLNDARRAGIGVGVTLRHRPKRADPMLWAADASAGLIGAFYAEQGRGSHHWFQQFRPVELHQHHVIVA